MEHKDKHKESSVKENLEAVGQIIVGEVEKIGGILTGDPVTNAEGDYNIGAGAAHQQVNRNRAAVEDEEEPDEK